MGASGPKAFFSIKNFLQKIGDAYDHAGMTAWRALVDEDFLKRRTPVHLPYAGKISAHWNDNKKKVQNGLFDLFHKKAATGDIAPKPGLKPAILKVVKIFAPAAAGIPWGGPAMKAGLATAFIIYALGSTHHAGDALTAWQAAGIAPGRKPQSGGARQAAAHDALTPSAQPSIS